MVTGIYKIENLSNGKVYIGSSISIQKRWGAHKNSLRRQVHENRHLQNAWNKYGPDGFKWDVLLQCRPSDRLFYEQRALDAYQSASVGYNKHPSAGSGAGLVLSAEARAKISAARKGKPLSEEHRAAISAGGLGTKRAPRSEEWRRKLSIAQTGKKLSEAQKAKIGAAHIGKKKPAQSAALMGRKLSESHRAAISAGHQRRLAKMRFA